MFPWLIFQKWQFSIFAKLKTTNTRVCESITNFIYGTAMAVKRGQDFRCLEDISTWHLKLEYSVRFHSSIQTKWIIFYNVSRLFLVTLGGNGGDDGAEWEELGGGSGRNLGRDWWWNWVHNIFLLHYLPAAKWDHVSSC